MPTYKAKGRAPEGAASCICGDSISCLLRTDFVPGGDQEASVVTHAAEHFVIMETKMAVHDNRVNDQGADEVVVRITAAVHAGIRVRGIQYANEFAITIKVDGRD